MRRGAPTRSRTRPRRRRIPRPVRGSDPRLLARRRSWPRERAEEALVDMAEGSASPSPSSPWRPLSPTPRLQLLGVSARAPTRALAAPSFRAMRVARSASASLSAVRSRSERHARDRLTRDSLALTARNNSAARSRSGRASSRIPRATGSSPASRPRWRQKRPSSRHQLAETARHLEGAEVTCPDAHRARRSRGSSPARAIAAHDQQLGFEQEVARSRQVPTRRSMTPRR